MPHFSEWSSNHDHSTTPPLNPEPFSEPISSRGEKITEAYDPYHKKIIAADSLAWAEQGINDLDQMMEKLLHFKLSGDLVQDAIAYYEIVSDWNDSSVIIRTIKDSSKSPKWWLSKTLEILEDVITTGRKHGNQTVIGKYYAKNIAPFEKELINRILEK